jgi:hypothetical protein
LGAAALLLTAGFLGAAAVVFTGAFGFVLGAVSALPVAAGLTVTAGVTLALPS